MVEAQPRDSDYPRLGAVRGLVVACRRAGRGLEAADYRARCREVALRRDVKATLQKVAAVAAAEALADGDAEGFDHLRGAWEQHSPDAAADDASRAVLARQVY